MHLMYKFRNGRSKQFQWKWCLKYIKTVDRLTWLHFAVTHTLEEFFSVILIISVSCLARSGEHLWYYTYNLNIPSSFRIKPSQVCGPYQEFNTTYGVITQNIDRWRAKTPIAGHIVDFVTSDEFLACILIALW